MALRSIKAAPDSQQQVDSVLQYLQEHAQHVDSVSISGNGDSTVLLPLAPNLQLDSLQLSGLRLKLQPRHGMLGVPELAAMVAILTQLRLSDCKLRNRVSAEALHAAMEHHLPQGLQHLCISLNSADVGVDFRFPPGVCQQLQQLTYLELAGSVEVGPRDVDPDPAVPVLQDLQGLTRLVDLRLDVYGAAGGVPASMLSGMHGLTRLELSREVQLDVNALDGKTRLQHLKLELYPPYEDEQPPAEATQLLSHLKHMQQLTYLDIPHSLLSPDQNKPPGEYYSALTASSKLEHLNISSCKLPGDAWQYMFDDDRPLPRLHYLGVACIQQPGGDQLLSPPTDSSLVSCCPSLQRLNLSFLQYSEYVLYKLHSLTELTGLTCLHMAHEKYTGEGLEVLAQLTGLQECKLLVPSSTQEDLLLQFTQLKQLTSLNYTGQYDGACFEQVSYNCFCFCCARLSVCLLCLICFSPGLAWMLAMSVYSFVHMLHTSGVTNCTDMHVVTLQGTNCDRQFCMH
jgi:hypothetical protein